MAPLFSMAIPEHLEKNFVTDFDGFVYYWPVGASGHYNSANLREIADELDERNREHQASIDAYFEEEAQKCTLSR